VSSPEKEDGVVYTPEEIVELILDRLKYRHSAALQGKIIDPACGSGAFLLPAARRLIAAGRRENWPEKEIVTALAANIVGADIDQQALQRCREELNNLVERQGLPPVSSWQLIHGDALAPETLGAEAGTFQFVVGNPPYVRIQNLGPERRRRLQQQWSSCQRGAADLFLAFFQLGFQLMNPGGSLGYITPRSYFTSEAGQELRKIFLDEDYLQEIIDFGRQQLFPQVTTYTAITIARRRSRRRALRRRQVTIERRDSDWQQRAWKERVLGSELALGENRWLVINSGDRKFINRCEQRGPSLGQKCAIHVGLATLADRVYILQQVEQQPGGTMLAVRDRQGQEHLLEEQLVVPISKVSRLQKNNQDQGWRIIFPYQRPAGRPLTEQEFSEKFPAGYQYLSQHRQRLAARGHKTKQWFEYGSTQGLKTTFGPKILVPPLSNCGQIFLFTRPEFTYFSGYGIFFSGNLPALFQRLQGDDFRRYLQLLGREYRGDYYAINKHLLQRFSLSDAEWSALGA